VLSMDLRKNSDYFPVQQYLIDSYNRDGVFTARYGLHPKILFRLILVFRAVP